MTTMFMMEKLTAESFPPLRSANRAVEERISHRSCRKISAFRPS